MHFVWHLRAAGIDPETGPEPADVIVALRDRVKTLKEMAERARVWYIGIETWDEAAVKKNLAPAGDVLRAARERLAASAEWTPDAVQAALQATAAALDIGIGKVAQPLRVAVTGTQVSPSIEHTVYLCGQDGALARIDAALARIG
jgi:glutamyl-tRNA synthetase